MQRLTAERSTERHADIREPRATWLSRTAAIAEVVGVLVAGIVLGRTVQTALGVESWKAVQAAMVESGEPDFWQLARLATVEQALKYGFAFLLLYALGRWHRGRRLSEYGFRTGGRSLGELTAIGLVTWAVGGVLPYALQTLAARFPVLGAGPAHWSLFPSTWSIGFIAYMAASSFLLVPIVEELYARGYQVARLREDYGAGGAVLLSATFFALAHGQYFRLEVLSLGMLGSIVVSSIAYGIVFLRTGSLVPVIVAHALINLPTPPAPWVQPAILASMVAVLLAARRPLAAWARDAAAVLGSTRGGPTALGAVVLLGCLALVATAGDGLPWLAAGLLAFAVGAHARERRAPAPLGSNPRRPE